MNPVAWKELLTWNDFAEAAWPSLIAQTMVFAYACLIPDSGQSLEIVLAVLAGYWLLTYRIWTARRAPVLAHGDAYFVRHGFLVLIPLAVVAALAGEQLRASL